MADVFISYAKAHVELTRALAQELEEKGVTVWWDTDLIAGESFRDRIVQEIKDCKAAIVIWTLTSVHSPFVLSEAERARTAHKLIQLRTNDVAASDLPPPFDTMHAPRIDDRRSIYAALAKLGVLRDEKTIPDDSRSPDRRSVPARGGMSPRRLVLAAVASLAALGLLWTIISLRKKPIPEPTLQSATESPVKTSAQRFFDELSKGLRDSSLFHVEVRLGRLGLMSRVEAVTELRKLWDKYAEIHCQIGRNGVTPGDPQHARTGIRGQIDTECDFTDLEGVAVTRRFPLEIEATPGERGTFLISGLWHAEEMWLWQPRPRN
jgi:hypothetical protein